MHEHRNTNDARVSTEPRGNDGRPWKLWLERYSPDCEWHLPHLQKNFSLVNHGLRFAEAGRNRQECDIHHRQALPSVFAVTKITFYALVGGRSKR
jgi:hypothetical protein